MNYSESFFFILAGILILVSLIIFLLILSKKREVSKIPSKGSEGINRSQGATNHKRVSEPVTAVDHELEQLIEIENSLLAVKELYLKRLISAEKYVQETRQIVQQKIK